ncbi:hypothetical protein AKJ09_05724 [Labilithrix luteola]|uniref:Uncharacterized protein n=1 Tax=Labilithrix luteola TaxID=1391654 RepID=A0A0K1PZU9_9BACT|nr:hypothetical protein AKJ09_05724 [Labilithrix luteola]
MIHLLHAVFRCPLVSRTGTSCDTSLDSGRRRDDFVTE